MTITENSERFQYFQTNFMKNENFFQDTGVLAFYLKVLRLKTQHFHTKLLCQKQMLRQIKWGEQNGLITEIGVLPVNTSFFENFVSV